MRGLPVVSVKLVARERLGPGAEATSVAPTGELAAVLDALDESEIVYRASFGATIELRIGDENASSTAHASFLPGDARRATRWLHRTVLKLFPASGYARKHASRHGLVKLLAALWRPF